MIGSCAITPSNLQYFAAMNVNQYDAGICGTCIRVNFKGKSVVVPVIDRCAGCTYGMIDISQKAFTDLDGALTAGVLDTSWEKVNCDGSSNQPPAPKHALELRGLAPEPVVEPEPVEQVKSSPPPKRTSKVVPTPTTLQPMKTPSVQILNQSSCSSNETFYSVIENDTCWTIALALESDLTVLKTRNNGLDCDNVVYGTNMCLS
jgi:hypothetical protein